MNDHIVVEGLQHVARNQAVVNAVVLVFLQFGELVLANVHHGCKVYRLKTLQRSSATKKG